MMSLKRKREDDTEETRLCSTCLAMTLTIKGLRALTSELGYQHLRPEEVARSAEQGCPFCALLSRYATHPDEDGYNRLFIEFAGSDEENENSEHGYPLQGEKVSHFLLARDEVGKSLDVFTTHGKAHENRLHIILILPKTMQLLSICTLCPYQFQ